MASAPAQHPPAPITVPCPSCASDAHTALHTARDRWFNGPGTFAYARCEACGLTYLRVRPALEAMGDYYPSNYVKRGRGPAWIHRLFRRYDLRRRVAVVRRLAGRGGRVLDVGCALGDFLAAARDAGLVVAGVEPAPWAAEATKARGIPVWPTTVADADLPSGVFDVATLWDVVEHLDHPGDDLRRIAAALKPGGWVIVTTPVLDGWEAKLWGTRWPGWDTPRHLVVFERATLARALREAGFGPVRWAYLSEGYLLTALAVSLFAKEYAPPPVPRLVDAVLNARPVRLLMQPVFALLDRAFGGGWVTAVAQRPTAEAATAAPVSPRQPAAA
ncbi:MAG: class I SAM-dependent methyltransferase [Ardenticatenales bacterium]